MPQFRTIEEFVLLLEGHQTDWRETKKYERDKECRSFADGYILAMGVALSYVRTSNLGIVHPPSEDKS
jgi:hypothetical protein